MDNWTAYHQSQPAENVDWAQLAQQWMAMRDSGPPPPQQRDWGDWTSREDQWRPPPPPQHYGGQYGGFRPPVDTWRPPVHQNNIYPPPSAPRPLFAAHREHREPPPSFFQNGPPKSQLHFFQDTPRVPQAPIPPPPPPAAEPVPPPPPLDVESRKKLPAWILEGLEKAEREKLKQMEKEEKLKKAEEEKARRRAEQGRSRFDSSSDEEENAGKTEKSAEIEEDEDLDEKREQFMRCVKSLMMSVLLEASNDAILRIVQEELKEHEKTKVENRKLSAEPKIVSKSSALAALAVFGDGDDSDEEASGSLDEIEKKEGESIEKVEKETFKAPVGIPTRKFSVQSVEEEEPSRKSPEEHRKSSKKSKKRSRSRSRERSRRHRSRSRSPEKRSEKRKRSRSSDRKRSRDHHHHHRR